MAEVLTAQIIPFRRPPTSLSRTQPTSENLSNSLKSLAQAMADQREAIAIWRNAVKNLAEHMRAMSDGLAAAKIDVAKKD